MNNDHIDELTREIDEAPTERRYVCKECKWQFYLDMCGMKYPIYCPHCGRQWIFKKTPTQIVEEIKTIYHCSQDEEKMEKLLNELKEMAETKEQ